MRSIIVTGGTRGLGLGIASRLTASGFRVIAIARSESAELLAAAAAAEKTGRGELHFRAYDLTETKGIPALVTGLNKEFEPIYGLINNAGIGTSGVLASMPDPQIARLVQLNLLSPITLSKYVVRRMMSKPPGRIVNISSIVASTGYHGLSVYSATKAALIGFTRSLAREVGPLGITVNAVAPGFTDTEMTRELDDGAREKIMRRSALRRLVSADDVAGAVEFLMSDAAQSITGTTLTVDAGNTA
ncbi:MAG TPA: SDR family oxidoreductase [Steroidobacteraceae bacterium]|jgi:3-oxoacyl-[acyl-carrier protein] reductase|nr:SDR family oxidoreductase [Steroidobacteraceae bacterium]